MFPAVQTNPDPSCGALWQGHRFTVEYFTLLAFPTQLRLLPAEFDAGVCIPWFHLISQLNCVYSSLLWQPPTPPLPCSSLCYSYLRNLLIPCLPISSICSLFSVWTQLRLLWEAHREGTKSGLGCSPQDCITDTSIPRALAEE